MAAIIEIRRQRVEEHEMARAPRSPIDRAMNGLHEAASAPSRIPLLKVELKALFRQVSNPRHRVFLEQTLREIEAARNSRQDLARIQRAIDDWNTREFPVERGYRR